MDGSRDDIIPDEFDPRNLSEELPFQNAKQTLLSEGFKWMLLRPAVYALFLNDVCQYIGSTMRLHARLVEHKTANKFTFNKIMVKFVSKDNMLEIEKYLVSLLEPPHNKDYTSKPKIRISKEELKNEVAKQRKLIGL